MNIIKIFILLQELVMSDLFENIDESMCIYVRL